MITSPCACFFRHTSTHIQDVVQVEVGKNGRDHRPLRTTFLRLVPLTLFYDARLEPFLNQADHTPISDPMLHKLDQPTMLESLSKKDRISRSRIQFTFLRTIPTHSASNASCWLRPGRKP